MSAKKKEKVVDTYSVTVYCRNCNTGGFKVSKDGEFFSDDFVVDIPKGTAIKDAKCTKCGCPKLSLVKD